MKTGGGPLRVVPWKGDAKIALLTPVGLQPAPTRRELAATLEQLAARGCELVFTGALDALSQRPYVAAGFEEHARLHVLGRSLEDLPRSPTAPPLRRARRRDRAEVHAVDTAAFTPFWHLGEAGLDDALAATPEARFRVVLETRVVAYAIHGCAGRQGYVQRLAVDPERCRMGLGTALVLDGLRWMRRRGAEDAVVNTQEDNDGALALYQGLGFRLRGPGLRVLRLELGSAARALVPDIGR